VQTSIVNSMFVLLCEFSIVLEYDEINCNLVFGVLIMYFEMEILVIWNNHEYGVLMNGNVKCGEKKAKIVNVCIWSANFLLQ